MLDLDAVVLLTVRDDMALAGLFRPRDGNVARGRDSKSQPSRARLPMQSTTAFEFTDLIHMYLRLFDT
jgi:hypothetical protein